MTSGADYEQYAERPQFHGAYTHHSIFFRALQRSSGAFADVGAGDGGKLRSALDAGALSNFSTIIAIDLSQERVKRLRRLVPEAKSQVGDAQALPLPDESIDFYYSDQVIEHVPNDVAAAREIYRVLKEGARGLIGSVVKRKGAWYFYRCNGQWRIDPTHIREYGSLEEYTRLFRSVGLEVLESCLEPMAFPITDISIRALLRFRLIGVNSSLEAYQRYPVLKYISSLKIPIPRYYVCYAVVQKPREPQTHKN